MPPRTLSVRLDYEHTAFAWSRAKKWRVVVITMLCQISMNFNAAIYPNAKGGMQEYFGVSATMTNLGQGLFLILYGIGCEVWAPWSEECGRKIIMQLSLGLVNLTQIPAARAYSFGVVLIMRLLGGISSAGGSVTLGLIPDMFDQGLEQQLAVSAVVWSSCAGSVIAPIAGGFLEQYGDWRLVFYTQLIAGLAVQILHLVLVPETRSTVMLDTEAKRRRDLVDVHPALENEPRHYWDVMGPLEAEGTLFERMSWHKTRELMFRPYRMLLTEPIVGLLSLLSGFSDMLIFLGLDAFGYILDLWNLPYWQKGLAFIPLLLSYVVGTLIAVLIYAYDNGVRVEKVERAKRRGEDEFHWTPERKLRPLCSFAPLLCLGLVVMGAGALGPQYVHSWVVLCVGSFVLGLANLAIYQYTIDYMVSAYHEYAASATGGNGFCRDVLAGCAAFWAKPFFSKFQENEKLKLAIPLWILSAIGAILCICVYVFYFWGAWFRKKSKFAGELAAERALSEPARQEAIIRTRGDSSTESPGWTRNNSVELANLFELEHATMEGRRTVMDQIYSGLSLFAAAPSTTAPVASTNRVSGMAHLRTSNASSSSLPAAEQARNPPESRAQTAPCSRRTSIADNAAAVDKKGLQVAIMERKESGSTVLSGESSSTGGCKAAPEKVDDKI